MSQGEHILGLMVAHGWSQDDLASVASVSPSALSQIINNRRKAQLGTLCRIAGAFGVSVVELEDKPRKLKKGRAKWNTKA